ncbi:MAG: helix-hairpin-helix domain-containing protein [Clostridia bacterium]|nr:helix-hairpin-helix domain-containing protein [Clostridia bacterium]
MRLAEKILWIAAAAFAVAVTVVCLRSTPDPAPSSETYESATLSLDEYGIVAFHVDLNTADKLQLMRLPGMTEETAEAIVSYRAYYGRFTDVREIGDVAGVTEAMRDRWLYYLTVGAENSAESSHEQLQKGK